MGIQISLEHYRQMRGHVAQDDPVEACGLLGGLREQVHEVIPVMNAAQSPVRFRMDPEEQIQALFRFEDRGWELIAIYHSHPGGPPGPSMTDLREAAYPEAIQLIWFQSDGEWTCRAYRYRDDVAEEVTLRIDSGEEESGRQGDDGDT